MTTSNDHAARNQRSAAGAAPLGIFQHHLFDLQLLRTMAYGQYGGAALGECLQAARAIRDRDMEGWAAAWRSLAENLRRDAGEAVSQGRRETAGQDLLRAANYFRTAQSYVRPGEDKRRLCVREAETFRQALDLLGTPAGAVDIPYGPITLPGYLFRPDRTNTKRSTIIMLGGADGSAEELYFLGGVPAALRRGYNVLTMAGPGHRSVLQHHPEHVFRPDYEAVVAAAIDFLEEEPAADDVHILVGYSLAGHLALRSACHEGRLDAVVANPPTMDLLQTALSALPSALTSGNSSNLARRLSNHLLRTGSHMARRMDPVLAFGIDMLAWTLGTEDLGESAQRLRDFSLDDASGINCPLLALVSAGEGSQVLSQARSVVERVSGPAVLRFFAPEEAADAHCQLNNLIRSHQVMYDWLDERLS